MLIEEKFQFESKQAKLSGEQFNFKADNKSVKEAVNTELTISEFAEYFTMRSDSEFVTKVSSINHTVWLPKEEL